ncbi:MAG: hypothetical protein WEB06_10055, partial [Actinomycetota bacterium]
SRRCAFGVEPSGSKGLHAIVEIGDPFASPQLKGSYPAGSATRPQFFGLTQGRRPGHPGSV